MNSFYRECKKKSRQMTELIIIGLIMVLYVIGSGWGTKIINYFNTPVAFDQAIEKLIENPRRDSLNSKDPHNQEISLTVNQQNMKLFLNEEKSNHQYFIYYMDNKRNMMIVVNHELGNQIQSSLSTGSSITLHGGFDEYGENEEKLKSTLPDQIIDNIVFREGFVGDSSILELQICFILSILLIVFIIGLLIFELRGGFLRKTNHQVNALSKEDQSLLDQDFRERLQKNKLSFGDEFLYLSKNWHYEIYKFSDIVLLYYQIHRYGSFNRYTLTGWTVDKQSFVISNNLTKEKLERYLQLIYERNSEITVEKTIEKRNIQLYYFKNLVQEMRDRQAINLQLDAVKHDHEIHRYKASKRIPIVLRHQERSAYRKRKSSRPIHH